MINQKALESALEIKIDDDNKAARKAFGIALARVFPFYIEEAPGHFVGQDGDITRAYNEVKRRVSKDHARFLTALLITHRTEDHMMRSKVLSTSSLFTDPREPISFPDQNARNFKRKFMAAVMRQYRRELSAAPLTLLDRMNRAQNPLKYSLKPLGRLKQNIGARLARKPYSYAL